MKKRVLSLFMAFTLCAGLIVPAAATPIEESQWISSYGGQYTSGGWSYDLKDDGTAVLRLSAITPSLAVNGTLTLPASLDGHKVTEVGDYFAAGSSPLHQTGSFSKLVIPEGYTSLGMCAFADFSLESVTLPSTLTYIDSNCFRQTNLKTVDFPASLAQMGGSVFDGCKMLENVTVRNPELELFLFGAKESPVLSTITCPHGSKAEQYALTHGLQAVYLDSTGPAAAVFADVSSSQYYYLPVLWAVEQGVTNGTSATTFSPDKVCTRGEILTFLWRAAGSPDYGLSGQFSDVHEGDFYAQAVSWAHQQGIIKAGSAGTTESSFSPNAPCTRAAAIQWIWGANGFQNYDALRDQASFSDVPGDAEYSSAVVWAVISEVTSGTSATTFSPDETCTRGQIVTFLWRAFAD